MTTTVTTASSAVTAPRNGEFSASVERGADTDVESVNDSNRSSVTNFTLPATNVVDSDEDASTTIIVDNDLEALLDSQFSSGSGCSKINASSAGVEIEKWLKRSAEDNVNVVADEDDEDFEHQHQYPKEAEIQKMAEALFNAVKNGSFQADAWHVTENLLHDADLSDIFISECQQRLSWVLMKTIMICCTAVNEESSQLDTLKRKNLRYDILERAARFTDDNENRPNPLKMNFDQLKSFQGHYYYSSLHLSSAFHKKISRKKQFLIQKVQEFVNESIQNAFETDNAVLFTGYGLIPKLVEDCDADEGLNLGPDKIAQCGLQLQRAVYDEMVGRCVDYLAYVGYNLNEKQKSDEIDNNLMNLWSGESAASQSSTSSTESEQHMDSQQSQGSSVGTEEEYDVPNNSPEWNNNELIVEIRNVEDVDVNDVVNPGVAVVYGDVEELRDSPGGSFESTLSQEQFQLTPSMYSPPRVPSPPVDEHNQLMEFVQQNEANEDYNFHPVLDLEEAQDLDALIRNVNPRGRDSSDDEGPQRLRPRMDDSFQ